MPELARHHEIRESSHRIVNPLTPQKLRQLGDALFLHPDTTILDLACGKGEMLCTWARDYGIVGTGVDISNVFIHAAERRATKLDVESLVTFVHADARGYVAETKVDVASCLGATWIGDGVEGAIDLLRESIVPGGIMLIGHPFWLQTPPDDETVKACGAESVSDWLLLPDLIESMQAHGCDVVEMVLADKDSWDRYQAAHWRNIRRFLDSHPDDELAPQFREEVVQAPRIYTRYQRDYLGWGVFALRDSI